MLRERGVAVEQRLEVVHMPVRVDAVPVTPQDGEYGKRLSLQGRAGIAVEQRCLCCGRPARPVSGTVSDHGECSVVAQHGYYQVANTIRAGSKDLHESPQGIETEKGGQHRIRGLAMQRATQGDGFRNLEEQVEAKLPHAHGTAEHRAARAIDVHPQAPGEITAVVFREHFLPDDHIGTQGRPVKRLPVRVIEQAFGKQRIQAQYHLLEQRPHLAQDRQGHILAHADVGDTDGIRSEHHAHGQAINQQGGTGVDPKRQLQAHINVVRGLSQLRVAAYPKSKVPAAVARTGQNSAKFSGADAACQQVADGKAFKQGGLIQHRYRGEYLCSGQAGGDLDAGLLEQQAVGT